MAALAEDVQAFIVQALACHDTPTEVAAAVMEEFGLTVDRRQVEQYDAERPGKKPAKKWVALFHATRAKFEREVDGVPIAKNVVRLRRLERLYQRAARMGNLPLAGELLERAAKEMGGAFTNRREHTGANGGPIETRDAALEQASTDELLALARELLAEQGERASPPDSLP